MYKQAFTTRWADFDPNRHMRHSAYYDYAAETRVRFFAENSFSIDDFARIQIGPILFKESCSFFKEIKLGGNITVNMQLVAASENLERWRFKHEIFNEAGDLAAELEVFGAWIDLKARKLTAPPPHVIALFKESLEQVDFYIIPSKS